ncbi:RrF2 family transcriptional regulator [Anaeromicrobium sediminis]|uniref:AsnC family transcriptional regulator n=1 Tax=Anaeromicrobium sediminis TaxID=1478221 RepID=A0A267MPV3_9FIRM|nr:Rrf2 family transcriptional regulator [Anaeromicrobium sediminis]PAB60918.1 AsnC family transcriptional regulator [Anaeromicrobium sediminis]
MKLSTKGRYGVKAMFELALAHGNGPTSLNIIAEKQNLSIHYLEQLFSSLRKAELVRSIRGAQGGYILARNPEEITVGEIIRTLEGPLAPSDCVIENEDKGHDCNRAGCCVTRTVWKKIWDSINDVVDNITLQDMIDDHDKMTSEEGYMYYI